MNPISLQVLGIMLKSGLCTRVAVSLESIGVAGGQKKDKLKVEFNRKWV